MEVTLEHSSSVHSWIFTDLSQQPHAPIFRIFCTAQFLKMEVANTSETPVTLYEFTMRHMQEEMNIYSTAVRTSDFAKLSPLIIPIYLTYEQQNGNCNAFTTRIWNLHVCTCSIQLGLKVNNATYRENSAVWSSLLPSNAQFETKCRCLPSLHF